MCAWPPSTFSSCAGGSSGGFVAALPFARARRPRDDAALSPQSRSLAGAGPNGAALRGVSTAPDTPTAATTVSLCGGTTANFWEFRQMPPYDLALFPNGAAGANVWVTTSGTVMTIPTDSLAAINTTTRVPTTVSLEADPTTGAVRTTKVGKAGAARNPIIVTPAAGAVTAQSDGIEWSIVQ